MRIEARSPGRTTPETPVSEALLLLLRDRIAGRYYDRPEIVDALARVILYTSHNAHS